MGLDISIYVEKRTGPGWELVFDEGTDSFYSHRRWFDGGRNSTLCAILGFNTDEYPGLEAIAPLKGVPEDQSSELSRYYDNEDDGSRASYLTLAELRAFDWQGKRYADYVHRPGATYADIAGTFYSRTIPLVEQQAGGDPESVRVVYFFSF